MNAAEHDHIRRRFGSLLREAERIPDIIGHILDLRHLVVVCENDGVACALELKQLLAQISSEILRSTLRMPIAATRRTGERVTVLAARRPSGKPTMVARTTPQSAT